ncbi:hypothetical protein [Legionella tunisiensis]|uniref:hypothetical protein n=1 Tax=Legionella tunisiensis TaxID=1034944 RepID=UPI0002F8E6F2|nr:hypothetical protein [Legionella tunisiensis]
MRENPVEGYLLYPKGSHLITAHRFPNPLLPNLEDVLNKAGFIESEISKLAKELRFVTKIDDPMVMLYDEVFDKGNSEQSIVIDRNFSAKKHQFIIFSN